MPMPGAAAAIACGCRATRQQRRSLALQRHKRVKGMVDEVFAKYDPDNSGSLNRLQVGEFLKDLNNGVSPTRDELDYVMTAADQARAGDGEVGAMLFDPRRDETPRGTAGHGHRRRVSRQQLVYAVDAWKAYKDNEAIINAFFDRYDLTKCGSLKHNELSQLLTDLGCGKIPSVSEVNYILYSADCKDGKIERAVNRMELMYAIGLWYALVDDEREKLQAASQLAGGRCVIC